MVRRIRTKCNGSREHVRIDLVVARNAPPQQLAPAPRQRAGVCAPRSVGGRRRGGGGGGGEEVELNAVERDFATPPEEQPALQFVRELLAPLIDVIVAVAADILRE